MTLALALSGARVPRLYAGCGPSAVARFVMPVRVNAINRVFGRRLSAHIPEEVVERIQPAVAHADAAPAVQGETRVVWVVAPTLNASPRVVFDAEGIAMLAVDLVSDIAPKASATAGVPATQVAALDAEFFAAVAAAVPVPPLAVAEEIQGDEATESLAGKIDHRGQFYHAD